MFIFGVNTSTIPCPNDQEMWHSGVSPQSFAPQVLLLFITFWSISGLVEMKNSLKKSVLLFLVLIAAFLHKCSAGSVIPLPNSTATSPDDLLARHERSLIFNINGGIAKVCVDEREWQQ